MEDDIPNYNGRVVDCDHIVQSGSIESVREQVNLLIDAVSKEGYTQLSGDLVAVNRMTNEVDIIRLNIREEETGTLPASFIGVSRLGFENRTETDLAFSDLEETFGLAACAVPFDDGSEGISHHVIVTGYESFAADVFRLIPSEVRDEDETYHHITKETD